MIRRRLFEIDEPGDRQAQKGVKQDEGQAEQQADRGVAKPQIMLNVGDEQIENAPVEHVDEQRQDENGHRVPGAAR